jgi:hypothetical protein
MLPWASENRMKTPAVEAARADGNARSNGISAGQLQRQLALGPYKRRSATTDGSSRAAGPATIPDQAADLAAMLDGLSMPCAHHRRTRMAASLHAARTGLSWPSGLARPVESALRIRCAGPASQELSKRMAIAEAELWRATVRVRSIIC